MAVAVGIGEAAGLAIVAALDDVLGNAGKVDARPACHGRLLAMGARLDRSSTRCRWLQTDEAFRPQRLVFDDLRGRG